MAVTEKKIPKIFDFNYEKEKLENFFIEIMKDKKLTFRSLAAKAETDHRLVYEIIKRGRHISTSNALKLSKGLDHSKTETDYFVTLVSFKQARDDDEREFFRTQLIHKRSEALSKTKPFSIDQYDYYSQWHHSVIRSLIGMYPFKDDFNWLADMLTPAISPEEARESVHLLKRLNLIKKDGKGFFRLTNRSISANLSNESKKKYHRACAEIVKKQIFYAYPDDCQVLSATFGISEAVYKITCDELKKVLDKIVKLVQNDKNASRVYQVQLTTVPLSKRIKS